MAFDFASVKAQTRKVVHDTMSVAALYSDAQVTDAEITVRFHTKINRFGDMLEHGWSEVVEGVNRLIFSSDELSEKSITLRNGGVVKLTAPGFEDISLALHVQEPATGPSQVVWQVSQE